MEKKEELKIKTNDFISLVKQLGQSIPKKGIVLQPYLIRTLGSLTSVRSRTLGRIDH